ncbi:MAG: HAMP domain-containing protein [Anaerolineaceae bacterium]|nr:HAMP domain-containing protein [Anaerolineaceae bacterium]
MSLRRKTLLIIGATLICLMIVIYAFSQAITMNGFLHLEETTVQRNVDRAINALNDEMDVIYSTNQDWANWTDTYNFVDDLNDNYREGNTHDGIFQSYDLNVMLFVNNKNEVAFAKAYDQDEDQEMPVPTSLDPYLKPDSILLNHVDANGELNKAGVKGILMLPEGPMMIVSSPILTTEKVGPTHGSIIWGRYLDAKEIQSIADKTKVALAIQEITQPSVSEDFGIASKYLNAGHSTLIRPLDSQLIAGYEILNDIYGNPGLIYRVTLPRDVYAQGLVSVSSFIVSLLVVGIIFVAATLILLEKVVLSRLADLNTSVSGIRISKDLTSRVKVAGNDELTSLGTAINGMLEALSQTHIELEQARDEALDALKLKAQIVGNISHDARTPLNVITLRVEMLKRGMYGALSDKQIELLDTVQVNANQLLFFIDNLLDQAQLEAGKVVIYKNEFSPAEFFKTLESSMKPLAGKKRLELKTEITEDVPARLMGDHQRLNQILSNLVVNAIKFTDEGGIKVRAFCPDNLHWGFQVSDTGSGIPKEAQQRIFEAFWQVDGSSTRKVNRGVGLGLSIVSQLTNLMNGKITIDSEEGVGSTFTVILPIELPEGEQVHE